jgi:hypothetical protein
MSALAKLAHQPFHDGDLVSPCSALDVSQEPPKVWAHRSGILKTLVAKGALSTEVVRLVASPGRAVDDMAPSGAS